MQGRAAELEQQPGDPGAEHDRDDSHLEPKERNRSSEPDDGRGPFEAAPDPFGPKAFLWQFVRGYRFTVSAGYASRMQWVPLPKPADGTLLHLLTELQ